MSTIKLSGLFGKLEKHFKEVGTKVARKAAIDMAFSASRRSFTSIAKTWQEDIRNKMLIPATNRNRAKHDSLSFNQGFPMAVKGKLANSIWYKVSILETAYGAAIRITQGFKKISKRGINYGNILDAGGKNGANEVLRDFKQRAYDILSNRIIAEATKRGF